MAPAEDALATCTVAAVPKRSSDQLRKILMVVPFNEVLQDVPSMLGREPEYGLLAGGAFERLRCDGRLCWACLDEANAFTPVQVPADWWPFQAGPRIPARDLPEAWVRGRWAPSRWLRPQYRRRAM